MDKTILTKLNDLNNLIHHPEYRESYEMIKSELDTIHKLKTAYYNHNKIINRSDIMRMKLRQKLLKKKMIELLDDAAAVKKCGF